MATTGLPVQSRARRRTLAVSLVALAVAIAGVGRPGASGPLRPNVLLINVDDLGWTDLSSQGSTYFETPHIDGLASAGVRFTDGYAAAAICSPSRAAILTGRYPARLGLTDWIRARFQGGAIPDDRRPPSAYVAHEFASLRVPPNPLWMEHDELTIAEVLRDAGYRTAHIGKWHLGADPWYPTTQGFDVNLGGCDFGQPPSYFDPFANERAGSIPTLPARTPGEHLTDREAEEAAAFIRASADRPFFLHLAFHAVHTPLQGRPDLVARYRTKPATSQGNPEYAAMVHGVDEAVGRVLAALDETGAARRTLVIFTSDNGGLLGPTDNRPLRSGKGFPYEGGIRVPFIVRWPGEIPAARVSHAPVMGIDLFPTIVEAAGLAPAGPPVDGRSLLAHLRSGGTAPLAPRLLFWHFPHYREGRTVTPYSVVRDGPWKLIRWDEGPRLELYNLRQDLGESVDLGPLLPDRAGELAAALDRWLASTGAKLPRAK